MLLFKGYKEEWLEWFFYFKIGKNVAFGAKDVEVKKPETQVKSKKPVKQAESRELEKLKLKGSDDTSDKGHSPDALYSPSEVSGMEDKYPQMQSQL